MRLSIVWVILKKELTETLRDRRTLGRLLLIPVLLYPLFALGISKLQGSEAEAREARSSSVAVWGEIPADLDGRLRRSGKLDLHPWKGAPGDVKAGIEAGTLSPPLDPEAESKPDAAREKTRGKKAKPSWSEPDNPVLAAARAAVSKREVDAVLVPLPGFSGAVTEGRRGRIAVYYDSVRADSAEAEDRVGAALVEAREELLSEREVSRGLPPGFTHALSILSRNVAPPSRRIGQILGAMMPMMLILMSLLGGFLPAIDLTAGEKERGTMQTLLCAPLRPIEIIWGKFLAVFTISLLTALANVVSMSMTLKRILPGEVPVQPWVYLLTFILLIPVSFLFSALFLGLSVFAKDFKDGQNVLMPVYLPITLLSALTGLPGIELDRWTAFAPILNIALLIKALFIGEASADLLLLTLGSSFLYASLALLLAARVFERENVLLGGRESLRELFGLVRRNGGEPTAAFSLTAISAVLVVVFYGSLLLERLGITAQLLLTQYGFFFLPAVALVIGFGFSFRDTFAVRSPGVRGAVGAALVGASAWTVVAGLIVRLVPVPESFARSLSDALSLGGKPFIMILLALAVTPAICEETLFRGLLFSGLRRLGPRAAIVISALIFGLAHASVYRLLPTAFLGVVLGYTRYKTRSLAGGMIVHALNNGIAMALLTFGAWSTRLTEAALPWSYTIGGSVVFTLGMLLLRSLPSEPTPPR